MLAGAVLTGGSSTRMGADKSLIEIDGVAMAVRVANALRSAGCSPVAMIGGDLDALTELGEFAVADLHPGAGPVGGIITAIRTLGASADGIVVSSCDLGFLAAEHVLELVGSFEANATYGAEITRRCDVVVARTEPGARVQPLLAVWNPNAMGRIEAAFGGGTRSVFGVLDVLDVVEVVVPSDGLRNINTPSDLDAGTS